MQTQLLLNRMEERFHQDDICWDARYHQEDERWVQVNENFDLLFARVDSLGTNQNKLESKMDLGNKVMEQMLKDQQLLAK